MPLRPARVSVSTTPIRLDSTQDNSASVSLVIRNRGQVAMYIGGPTVDSSTGYQLDAGDRMRLDLRSNDNGVWAVTASGTTEVHRLQLGTL